MIYSTNRTASLGYITGDVNESYFGAGAFNFMQENAQDELALFEAAIKSDIDEVLIGESAYELEALNENFVENAVNKIKEMMKKFIEWLKSVTRSAVAKLSQLLVRDNAKFVKIAEKQIKSMRTMSKFKYSGKGLVLSYFNKEIIEIPEVEPYYAQAAKEGVTETDLDRISNDIKHTLEEFKKVSMRDFFNDNCVKEYTDQNIDFVMGHIEILKSMDKKKLSKLRKDMKEMESKAKKLAREAESKSRNYEEKDTAESKLKKKQLAVMAEAASASKDFWQTFVADSLYTIKQQSKIARAVVAKAMGASPKNEAYGYDDEALIQAMIEAADYEYDEALEEMSEAKECDDIDDDFDDDDEE